jgi:hypothetical protein
MTPAPPVSSASEVQPRLIDPGYAVLAPAQTCLLLGTELTGLRELEASWNDLPPDLYLRDGGRYRRRRHACFIVDGERVEPAAHRAHWQPVEYNALHGGIERWFETMDSGICARRAWAQLLAGLGSVATAAKGQQRWYLEAHQFRIDTTDGIGRPTPEGAHRDGVDLVAVFLISRVGIKGGETRIFDADGPSGSRFTLTEPWSALLLDDARVVHESTPIQPVDPAQPAWRDTLVITLRRQGFQGPAD